MNPEPLPAPDDARPTSPMALAAAWTLVGLPLAWGVYQSAAAALKLFLS